MNTTVEIPLFFPAVMLKSWTNFLIEKTQQEVFYEQEVLFLQFISRYSE